VRRSVEIATTREDYYLLSTYIERGTHFLSRVVSPVAAPSSSSSRTIIGVKK